MIPFVSAAFSTWQKFSCHKDVKMSEPFNTDKSFQVQVDRTKTAGSLQVAGDGIDLEVLAAALLDDPSVKECVVIEREVQPGHSDLVAYVVVAERKFDQIEPRLQELSGGRIASFVSVSYLPVTDDGAIDEPALTRVPVWSDELATTWEARIAALPDIDRVASVSGYWADAPRHVHVARLVRAGATPVQVSRRAEAPLGSITAEQRASHAPASIRHGTPVPRRGDASQILPAALCAAPEETAIIYIDGDGSEQVESYGSLLREARR